MPNSDNHPSPSSALRCRPKRLFGISRNQNVVFGEFIWKSIWKFRWNLGFIGTYWFRVQGSLASFLVGNEGMETKLRLFYNWALYRNC